MPSATLRFGDFGQVEAGAEVIALAAQHDRARGRRAG